jgi:hypothetical protein
MGCIEKYRTADGAIAERDCYSGQKPQPQPEGGPGTELKKLLAGWPLYIKSTPTCSCNARARRMDEEEAREPGWCEAHLDEIVGWLREEATKRGLPFLDAAGRVLVKRAISNARKAEARRAGGSPHHD